MKIKSNKQVFLRVTIGKTMVILKQYLFIHQI